MKATQTLSTAMLVGVSIALFASQADAQSARREAAIERCIAQAQAQFHYNMAGGWFLTSSPIITADWTAPSGQQWTVPVGGGFGRVFKFEGQAYNASIAAYYNAVRPDNTAAWQLRFQFALLFPK